MSASTLAQDRGPYRSRPAGVIFEAVAARRGQLSLLGTSSLYHWAKMWGTSSSIVMVELGVQALSKTGHNPTAGLQASQEGRGGDKLWLSRGSYLC